MPENREEYIYHNGIAYASEKDEKEQKKEDRKKKSSPYGFTGMQLIVCAVILLAVLLLKAVRADWYEAVRSWYLENISRTVLIEYDPNEVKQKIVELFGQEKEA